MTDRKARAKAKATADPSPGSGGQMKRGVEAFGEF
jgi:hypothetical protein